MFDTEKFLRCVEQRPALYDVHSKDYSNRDIKVQLWFEIGEIMYEEWDSFSCDEQDLKAKDMAKKWKALRDNFVKYLKLVAKIEAGIPVVRRKKYVYSDNLQFLVPHIKLNVNTFTNNEVEDEDNTEEEQAADEEQVAEQHRVGTGTITRAAKRNRLGAFKLKRKLHQPQFLKRPALTSSPTRFVKKSTLGTSATSVPPPSRNTTVPENLTFRKEEEIDKYGHRAFLMSFVPILNSLPLHAAMQARLEISQVISENYFRSTQSCTYSMESAVAPTPASFQADSSEDLNNSGGFNLNSSKDGPVKSELIS